MASKGDSGCGCLILFVILCLVGGGLWQGIALAIGGWLIYLIIIGVSIGIVVAIIKAISGR